MNHFVHVAFAQSIAYKELFPVVIKAHVLGLQWFRQHILFRSNNEAVVNMLNSRMSKVPCLMFLFCKRLFSAAQSNFTFAAQHVPGIHNAVADALSRFHWQTSLLTRTMLPLVFALISRPQKLSLFERAV